MEQEAFLGSEWIQKVNITSSCLWAPLATALFSNYRLILLYMLFYKLLIIIERGKTYTFSFQTMHIYHLYLKSHNLNLNFSKEVGD